MKRLFLLTVLLGVQLFVAALYAQADQALISKAEKGDVRAMLTLAECYENGAGVAQDSAQALKWLQRAADKGDGDAWVCISRYYLESTLMPHDTARFIAISKEWSAKGNAEAMAMLSSAHLKGVGVKKDTAAAVDMLLKAVKMGSPRAINRLGEAYEWGELGFGVDSKKALDCFKKAYKGGFRFAAVRLWEYYSKTNDYKSALSYILNEARWREPFCMAQLAEAYYRGWGVTMDEAKAQEIITDVVDHFGRLQYVRSLAGQIFMFPDDLSLRDSARAMRYWNQGDALGSNLCRWNKAVFFSNYEGPEYSKLVVENLNKIIDNPDDDDFKGSACYELSRYNYLGYLGQPDTAACMSWLERGMRDYRDARCATTLGYYFSESDPGKTEYYYSEAYRLGSTEILPELAKVYASQGKTDKANECYDVMIAGGDQEGWFHKGVMLAEMNFESQARATLEEGVKKGCKQCSDALGNYYESTTPADYKKAAKYYEKSGSPYANYRMALLYLNENLGKGSDKDVKKGLDYLFRSKEQGQIDAYLALAYCYESGTTVGEVDYGKAKELYEELARNDVPVGYFRLGRYYEYGAGGIEADSLKAIENYRKAAEMGHGEAMCYIGDFYRIGQYLPLDKEEALRYYREADAAGEEIGTYYVGRSYLEGCGVIPDTAAAVSYLRRAAQQGVGQAAYLLGRFYDTGRGGLPVDADSAIHYYLIGHDGGSGDASYQMAVKLIGEEAWPQALDYTYVGAKRGNIDAIVLLGLFLQEGIATDADPVQAYQLFELAANRGRDARAYTYMGKARLQGNGCKQDEKIGKLYLDTAASMGNAQAMYLLGLCYMEGYGCMPDSVQSVEWLQRSAELGNTLAINLMGDIYEEQEDFESAVRYYQMGYDAGSLESCCNLGYCYEKGQGVVLSFKKAVELYTAAAERGSTRGMKMLGNCYLNEVAGDPNPAKAVEWFTKAADAGDAQAMYLLGSLYEEGDTDDYHFVKDLKKARQWYQKAADAGYEPAAVALKRVK